MKRGLLTGPDLNSVQEKALVIALILQRRQDQDRVNNQFETDLMIHRPEAYKEYKRAQEEQLEENLGYSEIIWRAPETVEEAAEIMSVVEQAHRQIKDIEEDPEEFEQQLEALKMFKGVDVTQLGDNDE